MCVYSVCTIIGTFQSIQHVILSGVGGGVPHVYEFEKHSRLGDIVVSAPSPNNSSSGKSPAWYVFCEKVDEVNGNNTSSIPLDGDVHQDQQQYEVRFTHKTFAPKNPVLLACAKALIEAGPSSWHPIIKEGLNNLKDHEFDYTRPAAETDKLKIQVSVYSVLVLNECYCIIHRCN